MEHQVYGQVAQRENFYFWHVGRREIIQEALRRNLTTLDNEILDVGCGPGGNIHTLQNFGRVTGLDISKEALCFAENRGFAKLIQADACNMPTSDGSFDLISGLDVLEHIQEDEKVIKEAFRILKPGGIFLVTVPVYPWLWSAHDEALHHVRRYTKKEILLKLEQAGFRIKERSYFVMLAVPVNLLRKIYRIIFSGANKKGETYDVKISSLINNALLFVLRCERYLIRSVSLPFGSSLMVVAQKPKL